MTHDRAEVSHVWRIENDHLWQSYATTRSQIKPLNAHSPQLSPIASMAGAAACWTDSLGLQTARNEVMLFSGAPSGQGGASDIISIIKQQGFDERVASLHGMFGAVRCIRHASDALTILLDLSVLVLDGFSHVYISRQSCYYQECLSDGCVLVKRRCILPRKARKQMHMRGRLEHQARLARQHSYSCPGCPSATLLSQGARTGTYGGLLLSRCNPCCLTVDWDSCH